MVDLKKNKNKKKKNFKIFCIFNMKIDTLFSCHTLLMISKCIQIQCILKSLIEYDMNTNYQFSY